MRGRDRWGSRGEREEDASWDEEEGGRKEEGGRREEGEEGRRAEGKEGERISIVHSSMKARLTKKDSLRDVSAQDLNNSCSCSTLLSGTLTPLASATWSRGSSPESSPRIVTLSIRMFSSVYREPSPWKQAHMHTLAYE